MFKNKYGELRGGWSIAIFLVLVYGLTQVLVSLGLSVLRQLIPQFSAGEWINLVLQIMCITMTLLVFKIVYKRPFKTMGLIREGWLKELLAGCAFGIVSIAAVFGGLVLSEQAAVSFVGFNAENTPGIMMWLVIFISVGFSEEIMTRGYIMTALKTTRNKYIVFFTPAVVFALLHLTNPNTSVLGLINIGLIGLLFAYMMIRTGKLWLPIGYHITWNFFQGSIFGMNVSGMETDSIINTEFTGANWITGGAFGAEGGIVTTIVILLGFVLLRYAVKKPSTPVWTFESDLPFVRGIR